MPTKTVTPSQAAQIIGVTTSQVRRLIRSGKIAARKVSSEDNQHGYRYRVLHSSVVRYAETPQSRGFPRGTKRG